MNLIEKTHALMTCKEVNIWHFPQREGAKFVYWIAGAGFEDGRYFDSYEQMIEAAYAHIDPLRFPLPKQIEPPFPAQCA